MTEEGAGKSPATDQAVADLVNRAVAGDTEAFGALYDLYLPPLYRYLYFRVGERADAEDLCEHVFLRAWETIGRYRWQGKPFAAWLYRIAHNSVVDFYRARRPTATLDSAESRALTVDTQPLLDQALMADELAEAIRQLTSDQQEVIRLKFLQGMDNAEIAAATGKGEGAIRALQLRALRALRSLLETERQGEPAVDARP